MKLSLSFTFPDTVDVSFAEYVMKYSVVNTHRGSSASSSFFGGRILRDLCLFENLLLSTLKVVFKNTSNNTRQRSRF